MQKPDNHSAETTEAEEFEAVWTEIGEPFAELWPGLNGTVKSVARDAFKAGRRAGLKVPALDKLTDEELEAFARSIVAPNPMNDPEIQGNWANDYD